MWRSTFVSRLDWAKWCGPGCCPRQLVGVILQRRPATSWSKTIDSLVILFYILAGLLTVENLPPWVRHGAIFPAVGAVILLVLVLLLYWRGEAFVDRFGCCISCQSDSLRR